MKSYNVVERKYELNEDKEISSKINATFIDLFNNYDKLSEESIINLRIIIKTIFSHLRSDEYNEAEFRAKLDNFLYPKIYFVGLSNLYSSDKHLQLIFLEKINDELNIELNKEIEEKNNKKIK